MQKLLPLEGGPPAAAGEEGPRLKLTVAKYYLPGGECIHERGIKPDIETPSGEIPEEKFFEYQALLRSEKPADFVEALRDKDAVRLAALAEGDGGDPARWPGFAEFFAGLGLKTLDQADVRRILREEARRAAAEDRGKAFVADLQEDETLRRAAREVLRRRGDDPDSFPEYRDKPAPGPAPAASPGPEKKASGAGK